jgi:hypothetical protein
MAKRFDDLRGGRLSHEQRLARLDTLANFMDAAIVVPGTNIRFGADALIGLVPGIGDFATAAVSCVIVLEARRMGAPGHLIARMIGNIAIDALAGSVPVIGDLVDVAFRANLRNMRLLRWHFEQA